MKKMQHIPCIACLHIHKTTIAEYLVPQVEQRKTGPIVIWIPVCYEHQINWQQRSDLPEFLLEKKAYRIA